MERSEILSTMSELKLYGMKAAFDEIIAMAVKRQHEPQRVVGDGTAARLGVQAAAAICGSRSLAAWKRCPKPVPSVPL